MYIIIWQYRINPESREEFIRHYSEDGVWVRFFRADKNFLETEFFHSKDELEYLTIDKWTNEDAYLKFKEENIASYNVLDKKCEGFTQEETLLGNYSK